MLKYRTLKCKSIIKSNTQKIKKKERKMNKRKESLQTKNVPINESKKTHLIGN